MSSTAQKIRSASTHLFIYVSILFLLLLASNNVNKYLSSGDVLGTESENLIQEDDHTFFWNNFLSSNPNYAPGWAELGREDKVKEIDPNWK